MKGLFRHMLRSFVLLALCAPAGLVFAQNNDEQMASYYYQNREYDKAAELYEGLYQRTQNKYYYQALYESYLALDRYKDAEKLVDKRVKQQPKDLTLWVDKGWILQKKESRTKAEKVYNEAIEKLGFDSKQLQDLVSAFQKIGRSDYAEKAYLSAREKSGNQYLYVVELATLYAQRGEYEKMVQEYFGLLDAAPGNLNSVQLSLQKAMNDTSNPKLAEGVRRAIIDRLRKQPNNKIYLEMMIWFSMQQKEFDFAFQQAKAVDARFPGEGERYVSDVAHIAHNNEDFKVASDAYSYLIKKGKENSYYFYGWTGLLQCKFDQLDHNHQLPKKDLDLLLREYESALEELGKNANTIQIMRNYAHLLAYQADEVQKASDILYDIVEMPRVQNNIADEVKLELGDLLLFAGSIWDASLLYSQVEKAHKEDVLGSFAKLKNAKLSYYNNDFDWAKSQFDVLRASTTKLIANDAMEMSLLISDNMEDDSTYSMLEYFAAADLLLYRNQLEEAWDAYDAVATHTMSHPLLDEVLLQKARIRMKQGRYTEAEELLAQLVNFYPTDILADDALMMQAELLENELKNPDKARECYEKLILDYSSSQYVERARKRYNELKTK